MSRTERRPINRLGPAIKTVLGDEIHFDTLKLPLRGCAPRDPTQLWRCRKHKRIEAECLLSLLPNAAVLDVGAHFGDTILTLALHARAQGRTDLRFWAVEPSRRKCKFIRTMVRNNGLQDAVTIVNACVGDECQMVRPVDEEARFARYDGRIAYKKQSEQAGRNGTETANDDAIVSASMYYFPKGRSNGDCEDDSGSESDSSSEEEDASVRMIALDSMKKEIMPLGLLHLDVEGWEARALSGAREILKETSDKCFVIAEVWSERDCKRRNEADLDEGKPDEGVLAAMAEHPHFHRLDDIVDQERNLMFEC